MRRTIKRSNRPAPFVNSWLRGGEIEIGDCARRDWWNVGIDERSGRCDSAEAPSLVGVSDSDRRV